MTRTILIILVMCSLISGACTSRKNKLDHSDLIPEDKLVSVLADVYIADGLLAMPRINYMFSSLDSLSAYKQVIEKHGYTFETMDKTMKYYFVKNPKKLISIYDKVLGILSEKESLAVKDVLLEQARVSNQWTGKEYYAFPSRSDAESTSFDILLDKQGTYTLNFSVTLFPDDQSFNPRITAYSCHADSIETGKKRYLETIRYIKDGQPHNYSLKIVVPEPVTSHLKGWLFDFDNNPDESEKHVLIETISVTFTY